MIQKFFLSVTVVWFTGSIYAQTKAYAITSPIKGSSNWSEIKLIDLTSGENVNTVYRNQQKAEAYSARTGKPIRFSENEPMARQKPMTMEMLRTEIKSGIGSKRTDSRSPADRNHPFATKSAACAYDKKTNRLYYTPMGIAQLRYIDLANPEKIYYHDDKQFGVVNKNSQIGDCITRMVFAADGYGYALTNDANHLIQFNNNKKVTISDMGALQDAVDNGENSIHKEIFEGGDIVGGADNNLYLVTGNHAIFKISIKTKIAAYMGKVEGLPEKYATNGAIVEEDDKIIVSSSMATEGYYRFSIKDLKAEKLPAAEPVYNASDLANGNLLFEKKSTAHVQTVLTAERGEVSVYPNPVTTNLLRVRFDNLPGGDYHVKLTNISGEIICSKDYTLLKGLKEVVFSIPKATAKGSYLLTVYNNENKGLNSIGIIVQ